MALVAFDLADCPLYCPPPMVMRTAKERVLIAVLLGLLSWRPEPYSEEDAVVRVRHLVAVEARR
jgi:hypothetical protein